MQSSKILVWNRRTSKVEVEEVYGDAMVRAFYETKLGQVFVDRFLSRSFPSRVYGAYQSSSLSRAQIEPFIRRFGIPMEDFRPGPFKTFNEFFVRQFKAGLRPFTENSTEFPAFSEARYLAYRSVERNQKLPVKGRLLSLERLLGGEERAKPFLDGPLLLARLCPVDYHRFHFPDSGRVTDSYRLHGKLHSVNPLALHYKDDILLTNERQVTLLETDQFGKLAYVEVGALGVGKIKQTYTQSHFQRGDEKGYFLFGASTVIVVGEPGKWTPDADLLEQTAQGRETLVLLGERVGQS